MKNNCSIHDLKPREDSPKHFKAGERFWLNEFAYSEKLKFGWKIVRV